MYKSHTVYYGGPPTPYMKYEETAQTVILNELGYTHM